METTDTPTEGKDRQVTIDLKDADKTTSIPEAMEAELGPLYDMFKRTPFTLYDIINKNRLHVRTPRQKVQERLNRFAAFGFLSVTVKNGQPAWKFMTDAEALKFLQTSIEQHRIFTDDLITNHNRIMMLYAKEPEMLPEPETTAPEEVRKSRKPRVVKLKPDSDAV